MDEKKIRDILKKAHPNREIVDADDERVTADPDAPDVDVAQTSVRTWRKFGAPPEKKAMRSKAKLQELFRPRELKGSGPAPKPGSGDAPATRAGTYERRSGKLTMKRLVKKGQGADTEDSLDVLVDEDEGIIGESDSRPEKKNKS
jgi:hypothetical protein